VHPQHRDILARPTSTLHSALATHLNHCGLKVMFIQIVIRYHDEYVGIGVSTPTDQNEDVGYVKIAFTTFP